MNENETDPRSAESSSPQRRESEQPTAAQPTVAGPAAPDASQSAAAPQTAAFPSVEPQTPAFPSAAPQTAAFPSVAPQTAAFESAAPSQSAASESVAPQSGAGQLGAGQPGSGQSAEAAPLPVGQWTNPEQHQPQTPWQQSDQHMPYGQQSGYAGYQQPHYAQQPGYQQQYGQHSAYAAWSQQQAATQTQQLPGAGGQPTWAAPVGMATQAPPRPGRGRKILAAGAAAVLIALAGGGVGAATVLALDDGNGSSPTVKTANSAVTRVVDRSSLAQIAAAVQDSVVSITTGSGEGSGVILSADGYIVTNNHVVATAQGTTVTVIFADGKKATATIVGTDQRTDLAVVKATGVSNLKAATFGSSAKMQVGDTVLAIGSPLGLEGSVTAGIISAKDRTIQSGSDQQQPQTPWGNGQQQAAPTTTMSGLLQTDAPINPGNSGGALVNTNGEVIGINSAIATQGAGSGNIGLGFAIPSDKAKQVADELMAGKKVSHPALGVSVTDAENGGALVSTVTPNSAAAKGGLQQGDVITAVDGKAVDNANDLVAAVQGGTVGQQMTLEFTRSGEKKTVSVTLAEAS